MIEELPENPADPTDISAPTAAPPTQAPEPAPSVDPIEAYLDATISEMSLEEKIGQMFICSFRDTAQGATEINAAMKSAIHDFHIGGVILFKENLSGKAQTKKLISDLQGESGIPLFIAVDEEGGTVSRLAALGYDRLPNASQVGSSGDSRLAYERGVTIAENLKELGFNLNFAPVADINTNKQNTVIGSRAFSSEPVAAGEMVQAFINGHQREGIFSTLKHFPGHGDTYEDSHYGLAFATHDMDRLNEKELVPFQMGIDAGAEFVMIGHISAPNVTGNDEPATFSEKIVTDILRKQLRFDGIIITDALDMGAVVKYHGSDEIAVKSILAGIDILLMPQNFELAYNGVLNAVKNGEINENRIDESVRRILIRKIQPI